MSPNLQIYEENALLEGSEGSQSSQQNQSAANLSGLPSSGRKGQNQV